MWFGVVSYVVGMVSLVMFSMEILYDQYLWLVICFFVVT